MLVVETPPSQRTPSSPQNENHRSMLRFQKTCTEATFWLGLFQRRPWRQNPKTPSPSWKTPKTPQNTENAPSPPLQGGPQGADHMAGAGKDPTSNTGFLKSQHASGNSRDRLELPGPPRFSAAAILQGAPKEDFSRKPRLNTNRNWTLCRKERTYTNRENARNPQKILPGDPLRYGCRRKP